MWVLTNQSSNGGDGFNGEEFVQQAMAERENKHLLSLVSSTVDVR